MNYSEKIKSFDETLCRFKMFSKDWQERDKELASRFNLFSILKIEWKEALVHTPLLANLLNPRGTHSQGSLFYDEFIKTILPENECGFFLDIIPEYLEIKDEKNTGDGQIDILIYSKNKDKSFVIVIENKIFASDQYQQLKRYYDYATKSFGTKVGNVKLVYLTPFQSMPNDESLEKTLKQELINSKTLLIISYREHIIIWLRKCVPLVKAPVVQYALKQYLLTVENLCYG